MDWRHSSNTLSYSRAISPIFPTISLDSTVYTAGPEDFLDFLYIGPIVYFTLVYCISKPLL
jgi:hypothetical protein